MSPRRQHCLLNYHHLVIILLSLVLLSSFASLIKCTEITIHDDNTVAEKRVLGASPPRLPENSNLLSYVDIVGRYQLIRNQSAAADSLSGGGEESILMDFSNVYLRFYITTQEDASSFESVPTNPHGNVAKVSLKLLMSQHSECVKYQDGCDRVKVELLHPRPSLQHHNEPLISQKTIQLKKGTSSYDVEFDVDSEMLSGESPPVLEVRITKITEALVGSIKMDSVQVLNSHSTHTWTFLSKQEQASKTNECPFNTQTDRRRIEVYGDSLTCGYGNLGKDPCPFTPQTEDSTQTYATLLADALNADVQVVCVSGIGLLHSYGSKTPISPVNQYVLLPQSLASDNTSKWDFSIYHPDLVTIYLGANDFSTQPQPTPEQYMSYYVKYLNNIWESYGKKSTPANFVLLCGWAERENPWCQYVEEVSHRWNDSFEESESFPRAHVIDISHIQKRPEMDGCNTHPNVEANRLIAQFVKPKIESIMGW